MTVCQLLRLIRKNLVLFLVVPAILATVAFAISQFVPSRWGLSLTAYVRPTSSATSANGGGPYTNDDMSASQMMADDAATLLDSDIVKQDVASRLGPSFYGYSLHVTSSSTTRVITLSVTGTDRENLSRVANDIFDTTQSYARDDMGIETFEKLSETAPYPAGPNRVMLILIAAVVGFLVSTAIIVARDVRARRGAASTTGDATPSGSA